MKKPPDPRELAEEILKRSICNVQVGAVIADSHGIFAWGWNSVGSGMGIHAEIHALSRANRKRLPGATIYVAAQRARNQKIVTAKPCPECAVAIPRNTFIRYRDENGDWT
jgi:deoxycytidylate deaminase